MNKRKRWILAVAAVVIIIIFLVVGRRWNMRIDRTVGGHCNYDSSRLGARVLAITVNDSNTLEAPVLVQVEVITKERGIDTVDLSRKYPYNMLSQQDWANTGLRVSDLIKCTFLWQTDGTCVPYMYRFRLEKYTGDQR